MIFPFQPNFDYCQIYIFAILVPLIQIFSNFWWIFVPPSADPRVYKKWVCGARDLRTLKLRPPLDIPAVVVRLLWWLSQRRHPHVYGLVPTSQSCNKNTKIQKYQNTEIQRWKIQNMSAKTSTQIRFGTSRQSCNWRHVNTFVTSTCTWLKYPFVKSTWTFSHIFPLTSVLHVFD